MFTPTHGPFFLMDLVGLDVVYDIEMSYYNESKDPKDYPPKALKDMIERKELGVKTGKGFYTYPNPEFGKPDFLKDEIKRVSRQALSAQLVGTKHEHDEGTMHRAPTNWISSSFPSRKQLLEQFLLALVQLGGDLDDDLNVLVSLSRTRLDADAHAAQGENLAALGPGRNGNLFGSV